MLQFWAENNLVDWPPPSTKYQKEVVLYLNQKSNGLRMCIQSLVSFPVEYRKEMV